MSNHLKNETSPYLLQHVENPVDWYPWGEDAFRKAKRENKPVFLSIGYSTCHWCHVMAHESFEDEEIAKILNEHFVSIKVDREERPDIDSIYMGICQVFSGHGGWPLTVFMTADQEPFFAGTYYPKESRGPRIGMRDLLMGVHEKWEKDREDLCHRAKFLVEDLQRFVKEAGKASMELPALAVEFYKNQFDEENGGFGSAPKFPMPHNLMFLLAYGARYQDRACLEMTEKTLRQMYRGGLFDHVGYGFSRYSTDEKFLVPHFEKMLYDNALLILAYCKAYEITGDTFYREVARKTGEYVLREMTSPEGGFYSAQDADSDGEEGKYYVFTPEEVIQVLGEKDGDHFNKQFHITKEGNFEGKSIPNLLAGDCKEQCASSQLEKLREYRKQRSSLHLDDKILTFWNSLMITAMCALYHATGEEKYRKAALQADEFIRKNLMEKGQLFVSYRKGKRGNAGFLDDYAGYLMAQLVLYRITLEEKYLGQAEELCEKVLKEFKEEERSGFFLYGKESEKLILRPKETYDGAVPSGNSLMAWNLVRLSQMTGDAKYEEEAVRQLDFMAADAGNSLTGYAMYLLALLEHLEPEEKIMIVEGEGFDREKLIREAPFSAMIQVLAEPTDEYPRVGERTTYYICRDHCCMPPVCEWK